MLNFSLGIKKKKQLYTADLKKVQKIVMARNEISSYSKKILLSRSPTLLLNGNLTKKITDWSKDAKKKVRKNAKGELFRQD